MTNTTQESKTRKKVRSLKAITEREQKLKEELEKLRTEKRAAKYEDKRKQDKKRTSELIKLSAAFDTLGLIDIGFNRALFLLHEAVQKYDLTNKAQLEDLFKKGETLKSELDAKKLKQSTG